MQDQYSRTQLLLGKEAMEKLHNSRVAVFGIGGVVTFKKSRLADTVREMELDDLVLETDCPWMATGRS